MAIKLSPRKEKIIVSSEFGILFAFSILLFLFASTSYFLLDYLNKQNEEKIEEVKEAIRDIDREIPDFRMKEAAAMEYEKIINDYIRVQEKRTVMASFLKALEKSTHSNVQIREARINADEKVARIEGVALNLEVLEQQHHIFRNLSLVKGEEEMINSVMEVNLLSLREEDTGERIFFEFSLDLNPELFENRKISVD